MTEIMWPAPRALPEAEVKLVTLLRADLVASTRLVAELSAEIAVQTLAPALRAMGEAVRRRGGTVCREMGDGVLAVFGAPVADDRHPAAAVLAAMDLVRSIGSIAGNFRVRVGVHTDLVVAHTVVTDYSQVYDMSGPALNLVERVQAKAGVNEILVTAATQEHAQASIEFALPRSARLRGFRALFPLYRALGAKKERSDRRHDLPFVGREADLAALRSAARQVLEASAMHVVRLVGAPGIGKSRLAYELAACVRADGWGIVTAKCDEFLSGSPYSLLRRLVRSIFERFRTEGPAKAGTMTEGWPPGPAAAVAWLTLADGRDPLWAASDADGRAELLLDAIVRLLSSPERSTATLLVLEDLQWADSSSLRTLEPAMARLATSPIFLLMTQRDGIARRWNLGDVRRLLPLDGDATVSFCRNALGAGITGALAGRIQRHAGGVPLFVQELCRLLKARGGELPTGRSPQFGESDSIDIPSTVHGILASRIDGLGSAAKRLLQLASTLGSELDRSDLTAAWALLDTADIAPLLNALLEDESLLPSVDDADRLGFCHDLLRQVAYRSMLKPRRSDFHAAALTALERSSAAPTNDRFGALCRHAVLAERWVEACGYARSVVSGCVAISAFADAAAHVEIALDSVDHFPAGREREELAIDLRVEARNAYSGAGRIDRWFQLTVEAAKRASALNDQTRQMVTQSVRAAASNFHCNARETIPQAEEALQRSEASGHVGWIAFAEYSLGQAYHGAGHFRKAERFLARCHARLISAPDAAVPGTTAEGMRILCCVMACSTAVGLDDPRSAKSHADEAAAIARIHDRPYDIVASGYAMGVHLLGSGEFDAAARALDGARDAAMLSGVRLFLPVIEGQRGVCQLAAGMPEAALQTLQAALALAREIGHRSSEVRAGTHAAVAAAALGQPTALDRLRVWRSTARRSGFDALALEATISICRHDSDERAAPRRLATLHAVEAKAVALGAVRLSRLAQETMLSLRARNPACQHREVRQHKTPTASRRGHESRRDLRDDLHEQEIPGRD